jgi:HEPN domain-containing protein
VEFVRDKEHWLRKFSPQEWIRAAMGEMKRAEQAYARRSVRAGLAGARRAAGMALNGALIVEPNDAWGRTYLEHLLALRKAEDVPEAVRKAAALLMEAAPLANQLVVLRSKDQDTRVLEAARDVMAHAYAVVVRNEPPASG